MSATKSRRSTETHAPPMLICKKMLGLNWGIGAIMAKSGTRNKIYVLSHQATVHDGDYHNHMLVYLEGKGIHGYLIMRIQVFNNARSASKQSLL
jgi:hypothetical protein